LKDERLGSARIEKVLEHLDYTDDQGKHCDLSVDDVLNRYNETAEVKADDIDSMLLSLRRDVDVNDELDDISCPNMQWNKLIPMLKSSQNYEQLILNN